MLVFGVSIPQKPVAWAVLTVSLVALSAVVGVRLVSLWLMRIFPSDSVAGAPAVVFPWLPVSVVRCVWVAFDVAFAVPLGAVLFTSLGALCRVFVSAVKS